MTDAVTDFLESYPEAVRDIAVALRRTIRAVLPEAAETLDRPGRVVGYGFGPGYAGLICTIIPSKRGVKLGITGGAHLLDPDGLLEGLGKKHRYVPLQSRSDATGQGVHRLLAAAGAACKARQSK